MSDTTYSTNIDPNDTSTNFNVGPPLLRVQPRCGHCGQFLAHPLEAFDEHINEHCRVGGVFINGKLRRRS
jgi:hypothetical protein